MTIYVLDTSGLIRSVQREAGGDRIEEILANCKLEFLPPKPTS